MNGAESSREQDLAMFSSDDMKPTLITDDEMKVNVYGKASEWRANQKLST